MKCTHVLVDDSMPLKEELVDAIVAKKPFVVHNWVEVYALQFQTGDCFLDLFPYIVIT